MKASSARPITPASATSFRPRANSACGNGADGTGISVAGFLGSTWQTIWMRVWTNWRPNPLTGLKIRLVIAVLVSALAMQVISPAAGFVWYGVSLIQEAYSWLVSHRQGRGETALARRLRAAYLVSLVTGCSGCCSAECSGSPVRLRGRRSRSPSGCLSSSSPRPMPTIAHGLPGGQRPARAWHAGLGAGRAKSLHLNLVPVVGFLALALIFACDSISSPFAGQTEIQPGPGPLHSEREVSGSCGQPDRRHHHDRHSGTEPTYTFHGQVPRLYPGGMVWGKDTKPPSGRRHLVAGSHPAFR